MKSVAISIAALGGLVSATLTVTQATPIYNAAESKAASIYTQIDCMERVGDSSGCWGAAPDNGAYLGPFGQNQIGTADQRGHYRAYFGYGGNDSRPYMRFWGIGR